MNEIRFIHISDLHIGKKSEEVLLYGGVNPEDSWTTLKKVIAHTNDVKANLLFISGDLFDEPASKEGLDALDEILQPLKDTAIIYCQGQHDYQKKNGALVSYEFLSNVYVPGCDSYNNKVDEDSVIYGYRDEKATAMMDIIRFKKMGICIYAPGYYRPVIKMHILDEITISDASLHNVLLAYGSPSGGIPVDYPKLRKNGFDYVGLGGLHGNKMMYNGKICYSGSPEPLSSEETGHHGYIEGVISDRGVSCSFHPASKKEYKTIDYPISNYMSNEELIDDLKRIMINEGKNNIFRINLVRQSGCEKTFDIQESVSEFRISDIEGERFIRKDYDEYIRANRGNKFGKLLLQMYGDSPEIEDSIKFAVDSIIETSGVCYRHNKKINDRTYEDMVKRVLQIFDEKKNKLQESEDVREYEKDRQMLESSKDVLDKLNEAWSEERKEELLLRTAKNNMEQVLPKHRSKWIKTGLRAAILPFMTYAILGLFVLPFIYVSMAQTMTKRDVAVFLVMGVLIIGVCFVLGFFASRVIDMNRGNVKSKKSQKSKGYREEVVEMQEKIDEHEKNAESLRKIRIKYQTMDNRRREIISDINTRQGSAEKAYYEIKLMEGAEKILSESLD